MISVIIPTLNEEKYLPQLLNCLRSQTFQDFEIIVADASSTDNTRKIALEYGARIVDGGIQAIGRNNGAINSSNGVIIFIDSDVTFNENFIWNLYKKFTESKLDLAIPLFYTENEKFKFRAFFKFSNIYKRVMSKTRFPDGTGQLVIAKKEKFLELGGFPDLRVAEDTLLFWKAASDKKFKTGIIDERFYSSTRRIEKIGIIWTLFIWSLIGIALALKIARGDRFQNFITSLYGGFKGW